MGGLWVVTLLYAWRPASLLTINWHFDKLPALIPIMKAEIHPTYHSPATITCACGATFTAGSTQESINIELCSACHPFYTGKQKIVDSARRVEKFEKRMANKSDDALDHAAKVAKKAARAKAKQDKREAAEKAAMEK